MARRRRRHEEAQRFKMRERLIAIGDDYWVEDQAGDRVFKVNGKVARVRDTRVLESVMGTDVAFVLAITAAVDALAHD